MRVSQGDIRLLLGASEGGDIVLSFRSADHAADGNGENIQERMQSSTFNPWIRQLAKLFDQSRPETRSGGSASLN